MKQVLIISGKGGTGKTVITGAFAALAQNKVMADCDVDAADLHLLLAPQVKEHHEFKSGVTATIDHSKCIRCGKCKEVCRFGAVGNDFSIDPIACEGCSFCFHVCPAAAIRMQENLSGEWFISQTRFGPLVHAKMGIAEENSGKLVSLVREKAKELAQEQKSDWIIIDGPPGIGCPVIASLSGVDRALVVTEPTFCGLHDADRVIQVARHFQVPVSLIINKYDLNPDVTGKIEKYCQRNDVPCLGKMKFDKSFVKAMVAGRTIIEYADGESAEVIRMIWRKLQN